jgi:hypothetical protein
MNEMWKMAQEVETIVRKIGEVDLDHNMVEGRLDDARQCILADAWGEEEVRIIEDKFGELYQALARHRRAMISAIIRGDWRAE